MMILMALATNEGVGSLWQWLQAHSAWLVWLSVLGVVSLVLTVLLLPLVIARLPADYFTALRVQSTARRGPGFWLYHIGKNLLGAVFVLAGVAMLFLPGQGLLTILIGLLLLDLPGKKGLERRILARPAIRRFLDGIRRKHGTPPLRLD